MNVDRLLVAIDGSPTAGEAVETAVALATANDAAITFVHGCERLKAERFELEPLEEESLGELRVIDSVLRDALAVAAAADVPADAILVGDERAGDLVPTVLGIADAVGAGMIVVGCRGRGGIASSVLGSVSHGLLRSSVVPVLVVGGRQLGRTGQPQALVGAST